ncbi:unnamed protein product [Merluccius merluccius]
MFRSRRYSDEIILLTVLVNYRMYPLDFWVSDPVTPSDTVTTTTPTPPHHHPLPSQPAGGGGGAERVCMLMSYKEEEEEGEEKEKREVEENQQRKHALLLPEATGLRLGDQDGPSDPAIVEIMYPLDFWVSDPVTPSDTVTTTTPTPPHHHPLPSQPAGGGGGAERVCMLMSYKEEEEEGEEKEKREVEENQQRKHALLLPEATGLRLGDQDGPSDPAIVEMAEGSSAQLCNSIKAQLQDTASRPRSHNGSIVSGEGGHCGSPHTGFISPSRMW